ncbi:NADP-dependent oxidoreductase [Natrinema gari]|uniref:Zn-dependent oxidoreductase, NADPH:quinone reductase n=1 Tax=Natrinema gari JCM 14663 TaxID=1230459 RepID=L9YNM6_9EURY|nr:NADP-dependent oxidoreductase [Natrinema gari]ELY75286.1 Zn-dependent oxidoreductase, NADPH:quinone reductase [Natrinema gari JCM 14663]
MTEHNTATTDRSAAGTMRAIRIHEHGGSDMLTAETVPRPEPGDDELLVRVRAAGVNPIDWMVREGYTDEALSPSLPTILGWDLSGIVEMVGAAVSEFEPGDEVFGLVGLPDPGGAYAEYAAVPADEVVTKPTPLSHADAAGLPMVGLTAWRALFDAGALRDGQRVLVHAAAGGVGHVAVQLAAHAGAHVVGTASGENEAYLRELGVDEFVNYRAERFERVVDSVDLVLDAVGGDTLERSIAVLADGGRIVTLPEPPSEAVCETVRQERNATVDWFSIEPDATTLAELRALIEDGHLRPTVSGSYPLSDVATAHQESEDGHVRGKLVLEVGGDRSP